MLSLKNKGSRMNPVSLSVDMGGSLLERKLEFLLELHSNVWSHLDLSSDGHVGQITGHASVVIELLNPPDHVSHVHNPYSLDLDVPLLGQFLESGKIRTFLGPDIYTQFYLK